MNKCDTCKYAEWEWSEIKMIEVCVGCTLGFRNKFVSDDDCGRYSPYCEAKMTESEVQEKLLSYAQKKIDNKVNV